MKITPFVIERFASFLIGSQVFDRIKAVVARQEEKDLPGGAKRLAALNELEVLGIELAQWIVNLGLELAVAYFRNRK